jgi:two-component system, sensor histidine kinase PdtaS
LALSSPGEANRLSILIDVPALQVHQDTAIPLAFLTTELVELAMTLDAGAAVRISVLKDAEPDRACLIMTSPALHQSERLEALLGKRYGRVLEGLSRQLRSPLGRDEAAGSFTVCFPIVAAAPETEK